MKKLLALILALTLVLGAAALPASAAFKDVSDPALSAKLDLLTALGVVNGYSDGTYKPEKTLSRAEFTKLVVTMLGQGEDSLSYADYTYFPDVRSGHWAARYVNYAARVLGLVKGDGTGKFNPNAPITCREAVTILLRSLGYTDEMLGGRWPENYLTKAASLGLTDGINLGPLANVTRKAGAELFYNALYTSAKEGGRMIDKLSGGIRTGVLLLSVNATAPDGTAGVLLTAAGETIKTRNPFPADYAGRRGTLVQDTAGYAIGFIPEAQTIRELFVSRTDSASVTAADGEYLRIPAGTVIYMDGEETAVKWSDIWFKLGVGTALKLAVSASGSIDYISVTTATEENSSVLVMETVPTYAGLCRLLGAPADARIVKNGILSDASDLRRWDVATYTAGSGVIRVSDFRLSGIYEGASPSVYTPDQIISLCGNTFDALETAAPSIKQFVTGDRFTMLFTADGKIAAVTGDDSVSGYQYGYFDGSAVTFPNGTKITASISRDPGVVRVSQTVRGSITAIPMPMNGLSDGWSVEKMTLGDAIVSPEVMILEQNGFSGAVHQVALSAIGTGFVEPSHLLYAAYDSAGRVNLIVINDVTGSGYLYGKVLNCTWDGEGSSASGLTYSLGYTVSFLSAAGSNSYHSAGEFHYRDTWCAISLNAAGNIQSLEPMEVYAGIRSADFSVNGTVKISGLSVPIAEDVQVYLRSSNTFLSASSYASAAEMIGTVKNMADAFTLCLDRTPSDGGLVRVIIVD